MANGGPFIIRYPRGCGENVPWKTAEYELMSPGHGQRVVEGRDIAVIAAGPSVWRAREAIEEFSREKGWTPSLYNIRYIKPIDEDLLKEACTGHRTIITIEDGCVAGGLHGAVSEYAAERFPGVEVLGIGIPDEFVAQASQAEQREYCGLTTGRILRTLLREAAKIK